MWNKICSLFASHKMKELDKIYVIPKKSSLGQGGNG